jgi:membrane protease YdiL (CAAX protease family)
MSLISERTTAVSSVPAGAIQPPPIKNSSARRIFFGPNGLRVVWRLLIFAALFGGLFAGTTLIRFGGIQGVRDAPRKLAQTIHTPLFMSKSEAIAFLLLCVATLIMGKIEGRKFREYGLSLRQALRKDFWVGSLIGFLAISGTLFMMFLFHGFRVTGLALHGTAILSSALEWGITFLLVGLCEEFMDRGYLQYTLATGIGFWPAAFVTSGLFAAGHIFNANETRIGLAAVVLFGLLLCLFLRRTGNLWCAVGFHMGYDWGQTFFYGVPDSGIVPYHNLLNSTLSGPRWLTGGIVGPEASVLTPIALLVVALVFSRFYRQNRYQIRKAGGSPASLGFAA